MMSPTSTTIHASYPTYASVMAFTSSYSGSLDKKTSRHDIISSLVLLKTTVGPQTGNFTQN